MRKVLLAVPLLFAVLFLASCSGEDDSVVQLDGPILETDGADGGLEFNGAVVNTAEFPVQSVYVVIFIKDSEENTLAVSSVLLDDGAKLYSDESAFFTATFDSLPPEAYSREVEIFYELVED